MVKCPELFITDDRMSCILKTKTRILVLFVIVAKPTRGHPVAIRYLRHIWRLETKWLMHNDLVKAKYTAVAFSFCAFYSQATKFPFQGKICGCPGHKLCNMLHFGPELQPRNIHFHFFILWKT